MGIIVMACYRPKGGKDKDLEVLMRGHLELLRREGLVTDRESTLARAPDGTFVEMFEWCSKGHMDAAHTNPRVLEMWAAFEEACDYVPVSRIPGADQLFTPLDPVD